MNLASAIATLNTLSPENLSELEAHVQYRVNRRVRNLRLTVRDGGLVVHGSTHTYYAKQLAQHAIMEAADLPLMANEIEVLHRGRAASVGPRTDVFTPRRHKSETRS